MAKQSIKINEFKINIGGEDYTFRLDFTALIKLEDKFGIDSIVFFNEFLQGKNTYKNIVRILSCSCIEKDFAEEELELGLPFNFKTMQLMDKIAFALVEGVFGEADNKGNNESKNVETSQKKA